MTPPSQYSNSWSSLSPDDLDKEGTLLMRATFSVWLDRVTGVVNETTWESDMSGPEKMYLREQIRDLAGENQTASTTACFPSGASNCAKGGAHFTAKFKAFRSASKGTQSFSTLQNGTITNNERMVMCSCFKSCGPYTESRNGFQSIREFVEASPYIIGLVYSATVKSTLTAWTIAGMLLVAWLFKRNSSDVCNDYAADQKFFFLDQINGLNKRNEQIKKKYNRLRMAVSE